MTPSLPTAVVALLRRGPAAGRELAQALKIHQSTLSRALRPLERSGQVVRLLGKTRGARYGLARAVGAVGTAWPLYRIDSAGTPLDIGTLRAIEPERFALRGSMPRMNGVFEGLPYFLQDARPAGFLGRAIPAAHRDLDLPGRVQDWSDDHVMTFVTLRGADNIGDLIVGTGALDRYLAGDGGPPTVEVDARPTAYPSLAQAAMAGASPGSSAQGENPKFSVRIASAHAITHALVKFSPPRATPLGARWADLLIAEHLASLVLGEFGITAARSELLEYDGRAYLQSERFDRIAADGRRGAVSLQSVDLDRYGMLDRWSLAAERLHADGLLCPDDLERIRLLDLFGDLIGNSDRHFGNITLFDRYTGPFELAPVYDMLPMLFAPQDGQIIERSFAPIGPTAATFTAWPKARSAAQTYWRRLTQDPRIGEEFRRHCARCLATIESLPARGA